MKNYDVIIIGGGWSGIYTLKHCLENGLTAIVFEAAKELGGQWVFRPNQAGGVLKTTISVSSKLYMSPSDFPMPDDYPEFPTAAQVLTHFKNYIQHFDLMPHISVNSRVQEIEKTANGWEVEVNGEVFKSKNLVVATGTNLKPKYPKEPMYQQFSGTTSHIADFKGDVTPFTGKRVLFVGGSDSTCDMAHQLRDEAEVTVSMRRGAWFQSRDQGDFQKRMLGRPADMFYSSFINKLVEVFGTGTVNQLTTGRIEKFWGKSGSDIPEWKSEAGYLNTYYTKSRHLVFDVRSGKIKARRGVQAVKGNQVWFEGEDLPQTFDHIVFGTGYSDKTNFNAPFDQQTKRYRMVLDAEDTTLAWVGYVRAYVTSITMLCEMQSRWLADVFSGKVKVPNYERRMKTIQKENDYLAKRFPIHHEDMPFLIDPYRYCKQLASDMKQIPNKLKLLFTKPMILRDNIFNSWSHYQFRLNDKDVSKRKIAEQEIIKLRSNVISQLLRREASMVNSVRAFAIRTVKKQFGENSAVSIYFAKVMQSIFKIKKPKVAYELQLEHLNASEAMLVILAQLALQDGILDDVKLQFLKMVREDYQISPALDSIIELAREVGVAQLGEQINSDYQDDLVRLAFDLAVCNGRFDMREAAYLEKLLDLFAVSDLVIDLIKGSDYILKLSEGRRAVVLRLLESMILNEISV